MDKLKRLITLFARIGRRVGKYVILAARTEDVVAGADDYELRGGYSLERIRPELLPSIEKSRPGYLRVARRHFSAGSEGFCVRHQSVVCAIGWINVNSNRKTRRVWYYPLRPGHVWLCGDWVNPSYRGRGLHKCLLYHRALYIQENIGNVVMEVNINPGNAISLHNYKRMGFQEQRMLKVLSLYWWSWCWETPLTYDSAHDGHPGK